ncbi:uncharacterized protein LOC109819603 [Asparagus officinalis]|uniref:uncharacterized protein LOC109819603 n=1 Tax=Asparagus officinalis TaxID=4686 RepID=UPI00098E6A29|nr:uncharacterized protein LOC109819603 [Asparagus officinalis]
MVKESPLTLSSNSSSSSSINEHLMSGIIVSNGHKENSALLQNTEVSDCGKCLTESKELVPCVSSASSASNMTHSKKTCNLASTSKQVDLEPSSTNTDTVFVPVEEDADSINDNVSQHSSVRFSSSVSRLEPIDTPPIVNLTSEIPDAGSTIASTAAILSSISNLRAEEPLLEATLSGEDFLTVETRSHGNDLHVDVMSIPSNNIPSGTADISRNEVRRNSRRLFWDALSRRSTRRNYDSEILSSTEDNDELGFNDRWLLDISNDLFRTRFDHDSVFLQRRRHGFNGRRWHSRSEIRERLRVGSNNDRRQTNFCPSGLHPDGRCTCDSLFMHEESSTRASISRIVLLAEALFEVLDEIHRQPVSLSLSVVSLPAPESVVNALPVKTYIKHDAVETYDLEQCYICLAEYEEGDSIRVLPCRHEYHMSCVDKWLKEMHGVCPLCRQDVSQVTAEVIT